MAKITLEVETQDVDALLENVRGLDLADNVRVMACTQVRRMNGKVTVEGDLPDGVDPNGLLVVFELDGHQLPVCWLDAQSEPAIDAFISLERLGGGDDLAVVRDLDVRPFRRCSPQAVGARPGRQATRGRALPGVGRVPARW